MKCQPTYGCPVEVTLSVIGGKWKLLVLGRINDGVSRFGQLRRIIPGITQTMLTQQLRELEEDGIVSRTIFPEIPPRVEYELTDFGRSLESVITAMEVWGTNYAEKVCANKRAARGLEGAQLSDTPVADETDADLRVLQM
ncbi:MAG: helix-turn-helix transcriptional regulator [Phycisphaerae bacterium]|nr:helix-turn-helix transcriptional regulator [Gemmatimonadaceae bacterium]